MSTPTYAFLINDRQIPHFKVGMSKILDEDGLKLIQAALKEYHNKTKLVTS